MSSPPPSKAAAPAEPGGGSVVAVELSVIAVTFGVIFVAELPDKTMIAAIVLASRHRPLPVYVGAAAAMVVNSAVAVGAGRLLELLPHRAVEGVVAALFAAGSLYLLLTAEAAAEGEGEKKAAKMVSDRHIVLASLEIGRASCRERV